MPSDYRGKIKGDPRLITILTDVIHRGFPHKHQYAPITPLEIRWNNRLRSTVGRVYWGGPLTLIEISPTYHRAHPDELIETITHEFAHVLHPDVGHAKPWQEEFSHALERLGIPVPSRLSTARHPAPHHGRYLWLCIACGNTVGKRSRRAPQEVAMRSTCCQAPILVHDCQTGRIAPERRHKVSCRQCQVHYRAYNHIEDAQRFAGRHQCQCGQKLTIQRPLTK